jgi:hypothetical protein
MNEDDHCATKKCPRGFEQHAEDETSTCFPKASTLSGGGGGNGKSRHTTTTVIQQQQPQTITGFNATFYDANTPYCWYTVNAPPCYDIKTGTVIH